MNRFEGKVVLITGAASGIGRATAERLASEGARLFLVDLAKEGLDETAKRCTDAGAEVENASCDVSNEAQVNDAVARCVDRFGRLDVLVNVAGILLLAHAHETA
ncbi:MAG: SDR family NAD(P)-dependent oxidoreductase, partial [Myxococcota bacterium]